MSAAERGVYCTARTSRCAAPTMTRLLISIVPSPLTKDSVPTYNCQLSCLVWTSLLVLSNHALMICPGLGRVQLPASKDASVAEKGDRLPQQHVFGGAGTSNPSWGLHQRTHHILSRASFHYPVTRLTCCMHAALSKHPFTGLL